MAYNYARLQNPFEFGTRYLLGDDRYRNFGVSLRNLPAGLYYLLLCPPRIEPEIPFVPLVLRSPHFALPPGYFLERIAGVVALPADRPGTGGSPSGETRGGEPSGPCAARRDGGVRCELRDLHRAGAVLFATLRSRLHADAAVRQLRRRCCAASRLRRGTQL